jgi:hypothetical protein
VCAGMLLIAVGALAALSGADVYAPPAGGHFGYNRFVPKTNPGDHLRGSRLQGDRTAPHVDHGLDDIYARNMWWSAGCDPLRAPYLRRAGQGETTGTSSMSPPGRVTHTGIPFGSFAADGRLRSCESQCPLLPRRRSGRRTRGDPSVTLHRIGSWSDTVYFTAPGPLAGLGGSLNWLDASGRYMLSATGRSPPCICMTGKIWRLDPMESNSMPGTTSRRAPIVGLSPDGQYHRWVRQSPGRAERRRQGVSWKLDHSKRAVASTPTSSGHSAAIMARSYRHPMAATT